jgi:hypothetical protein
VKYNNGKPNNGFYTTADTMAVMFSQRCWVFCLKSSVEFLAWADSIACFNLFGRMQNHNISLFDYLPDFCG